MYARSCVSPRSMLEIIVVADRGMMSEATVEGLVAMNPPVHYTMRASKW
jgi:hypothetical protein